MRHVVEKRVVGVQVPVVRERGHRVRFRLLYYLAVFLAAAVMAGVLRLAGT